MKEALRNRSKPLEPTERPVMEVHLISLRESLQEYIDMKFEILEKRLERRLEEIKYNRGK